MKIRFMVTPYQIGTASDLPAGVRDKDSAYGILQLLYSLNDEIKPMGWDLPPALGMIRRRNSASNKQVYVEFEAFPGFDVAYHRANERYGRPHPALVELADMMRPEIEKYPEMVPLNMIASLLITEAWMLESAGPQSEETERATRERRLHEHPDRVECRMFIAVDTQGIRYQLIQPRDRKVIHNVTDPLSLSKGMSVTGDVPNALHYWTAVATGQNPLPWRDWQKIYDYEDYAEQTLGNEGGPTAESA